MAGDKQGKVSESGADAPRLTHLPDTSERLRIRAAWLYFVEGRTQNEIAGLLGVGRVTVVRLLADARRRREVRVSIDGPLVELTGIERALEARYGIERAIVAPLSDPSADPNPVIAAAAGSYVSNVMRPGIKVGVGWGRTLHAMLPFMVGQTLADVQVVSLLGGVGQARGFNPTEFAWRFSELYQGEAYLVPAPAVVDSTETRNALLERCGIQEVFDRVADLDLVLLSAGDIATLNTSYRVGHVSERERASLLKAGAVGDVLFRFIDAEGHSVDHPLNARTLAADLDRLSKVPTRILVSGGPDKVDVLKGALARIRPTVFVTDEVTAGAMADHGDAEA